MSSEIATRLGLSLRQYWWVFWCLAAAYLSGLIFQIIQRNCSGCPEILDPLGNIGLPIFLSKFIALCYLQPQKKWQIIVLPLLLALLCIRGLSFMQLFVEYHDIGRGTPILTLAITYFLTLFSVDTVVMYLSGSLNRKVFWTFIAINLMLTKWLSEFLVFATDF